jgi:hypothetical protein
METKKISVNGLVRKRVDEGKPVFAVLPDGNIQHVGFTSAGYKEYTVPVEAVAIVYPLWSSRDGYIFVHEAFEGMPERGSVATWEYKRGFAEAVAQLLGVPVDSVAVRELIKRVARLVR